MALRKRVRTERTRMGKRLQSQGDWDFFITQVASLSRVHQVPMAVCRGPGGEAVLVLGTLGLDGLVPVAAADMTERGQRVTATWRLRRDGWALFTALAGPVAASGPRKRGRPRVAALPERATVAGDMDVLGLAPGEDAEVVS